MDQFTLFMWTVFLLGCISAEEIKDDNGYIFTCPRSLKTGATNQMKFSRYGELNEGELKVKIYYQDSYSSNESIAVDKSFSIEEGVVDTFLDIFIHPFENYVYNGRVAINGTFGDYNIGGSDKVYFQNSQDNITFIQTDKPLYKAGQTVKFRIMRVDKRLTPLTDDEANIWVEDSSGSRLFQWNDVCLKEGLKQFEFLLADEPAKGEWKISVSFNGETTSTTFEVKEYVLPTFEVTIKQPPFVLANAETIPISICAKYTYGKPVQGTLRMNVSLETYAWSNDKLPTLEYDGEIEGCFEYKINVSLINTEDYYRYRRIQVVVSVKETATGNERNETQYIQRQYSPLTLSFNNENQNQYYKPGLPYNGKLTVKNPDNTPAADEGVQISYTVTKERVVMDGEWKATRTVKFSQNYTSNERGEIEFIIPRQNTDSVGITIEAKSLKYATQSKKAGANRQDSLSQPQTSMSLSPWYSPSGSFIQLQQVSERLPCGTKYAFKLLFTSKNDADFTFHYQVLHQGKVMQKGKVEKSFSVNDDVASKYEDESKVIDDVEVQIVPAPDSTEQGFNTRESEEGSDSKEQCKSAKEARYVPPVGEVDIVIDIGSSLSSTRTLLLSYVREDREVVADSLKFGVEKCFKNQVKLQFGDEVKQPGTKTSIKLTSSPNSLCGIKVVDKSVSLLNSDDQLTPEKVYRFLDSLDTGMYYGVNHCNEEVRQPGLYASNSRLIYPPRPPQPWSSSSYQDSLVAFENAGFLVISDLTVFTRPCKSRGGGGNIVYEDSSYENYGGAVNSKVALASTARRPARPQAAPPRAGAGGFAASSDDEEFGTKSVVDVRTEFPDTWLFDLESTGDDGTYLTKVKLPHTITEWIGSAVCINEQDGLGLSNTTTIKGFQAFFLSLSLPASVIRGEIVTIPVSVFSYANGDLPITISVDESDSFEVVKPIDGDVCVKPGSSSNHKLILKATKLEAQNITVRAETAQSSDVCGSENVSDALAKDAITKSLLVEAEGFPVEKTESALFCPEDEKKEVYTRTFSVDEPEDLVLDSARAYIDITGNVLGKSFDNLENLVTLPTGCGEQNMVKFAPNVIAMEVLESTNQLQEPMKRRIERNLNTGYQRQLQYKHSDNSFSAFGPRDKNGSMFLTAFVCKYFSLASKYISIDNRTIIGMQQWIESKQGADGCFPNVGRIIDRGIEGSITKKKSEGAITAYVVIALLTSKYSNETVINKALSCIKNSDDTSFYATFLYSYAEAIADKMDSATKRLDSVEGRAITKGKVKYYHDVNATKSQDVETNAYAILAMLDSGESVSDSLPYVQYLSQNMNPHGGFYSTQDTCVGMEALAKFAKLTHNQEVNIDVKLTGGVEKDIQIVEDEKLLVKRYKASGVPSEINVEATGSGCALIQKIVRYNTNTSPEKRTFNIEVEAVCDGEDCKRGTITITASVIAEDVKTGMTIIKITLPSGIVGNKESLDGLLNDKNSKVKRIDHEKNTMSMYFDEASNEPIIVIFVFEKLFEVEDLQPGSATIFDYYDTEKSGSTTYNLKKCGESSSCPKEP